MDHLAGVSRRGSRGHRALTPPLACCPGRRARRIHLRARPVEEWRRGGSRACAGARSRDPCRAGQSRRADRAVPQHDADFAGDHEAQVDRLITAFGEIAARLAA